MMLGDDQERFEDYLELERHLDRLQADQAAHQPNEPPVTLTPAQAHVWRMAALFRAATPDAAEPRPEFAAALQARLEQEIQQQQQQPPAAPSARAAAAAPDPAPRSEPAPTPLRRRPRVSRRALIASGAAAAATLALGAGIEHALDGTSPTSATLPGPTPTTPPINYPLVGPQANSGWHQVGTVAQLADNALRFTTDTIVGYVIRDTSGDGSNQYPIIAFSAACTHMGCIVQWQNDDRRFHCPCHGGVFTTYGQADQSSSGIRYLSDLPRIDTKVEDGKIFVRVPKNHP